MGIFGLNGSYNFNTHQVSNAKPTLLYQFSRPVDKSRLPAFTLSSSDVFGQFPLLDTTTNGAQIQISPHLSLAPGNYSLFNNGTFYDSNGLYNASVPSLSLIVPNVLTVTASSDLKAAQTGNQVKLLASTSTTLGTVTSYQWTQTTGPTVTLQNANSASPSFVVPTISAGSSLLTFKVTVTNSLGFVQTAIVNVYAYQDVNSFVLLDYTSDKGDYIGGGGSEAFLGGANIKFSGTKNLISSSVSQGNSWWSLDLSSPITALATGTYTNATRYPFNGTGLGLSFSGSGRGCNTLTGSYTIFDIAYDGSGNIVRLAADFTQHCEGGKPALYGRIRYHSLSNI